SIIPFGNIRAVDYVKVKLTSADVLVIKSRCWRCFSNLTILSPFTKPSYFNVIEAAQLAEANESEVTAATKIVVFLLICIIFSLLNLFLRDTRFLQLSLTYIEHQSCQSLIVFIKQQGIKLIANYDGCDVKQPDSLTIG